MSQPRSDQPNMEEEASSTRQISIASDELPSNSLATDGGGLVVSSEKSLPNQNQVSITEMNAPVPQFSDSRGQFSSHTRPPDFISAGSSPAFMSAPASMSQHFTECLDDNRSFSNYAEPKQSSSHGFAPSTRIVGLSGLDILAAISAQNSLNEQSAARGSNVYETSSTSSLAQYTSNLPPSQLLQQRFHHQQNIQNPNVASFQGSQQFMGYVQGQQQLMRQQQQELPIQQSYFLPPHNGQQQPSQSYQYPWQH